MRRLGLLQSLLPVAVMAAALAGCGGKPQHFHMNNVTGSMPDLKLFGATDTEGRMRTAADYGGKIVVMYFGYTHCPDVCPLTLLKLHKALEALDDGRASKVQVLFVTVDPRRDKLALLGHYVHAFDPRFDALRLTGSALASLSGRYDVAYTYGPPDASGDYSVSHSAGVYVFDRSGRLRLLGTSADSAKDMSSDLRKLINARRPWWEIWG